MTTQSTSIQQPQKQQQQQQPQQQEEDLNIDDEKSKIKKTSKFSVEVQSTSSTRRSRTRAAMRRDAVQRRSLIYHSQSDNNNKRRLSTNFENDNSTKQTLSTPIKQHPTTNDIPIVVPPTPLVAATPKRRRSKSFHSSPINIQQQSVFDIDNDIIDNNDNDNDNGLKMNILDDNIDLKSQESLQSDRIINKRLSINDSTISYAQSISSPSITSTTNVNVHDNINDDTATPPVAPPLTPSSSTSRHSTRPVQSIDSPRLSIVSTIKRRHNKPAVIKNLAEALNATLSDDDDDDDDADKDNDDIYNDNEMNSNDSAFTPKSHAPNNNEPVDKNEIQDNDQQSTIQSNQEQHSDVIISQQYLTMDVPFQFGSASRASGIVKKKKKYFFAISF